MRRPTVIVMTLIGQRLRPFLMEGQDKPHWRDASYYPERSPGSRPEPSIGWGLPGSSAESPRWPGDIGVSILQG